MRHPDISTAQLIAEYQAGDSLRIIAQRHGISHQTVADRLDAAGVDRRAEYSHRKLVCPFCNCSFRPKEAGQERCHPNCKPSRHAATCKRGHPLTPENLTSHRGGRGGPQCRRCLYAAQQRYAAKKKACKSTSTS